MTDNVAVLDGFTREIIADSGNHTLYLLVKPTTDFGDRFKAWDMDEQEYIHVNGWLFTCEDVEQPYGWTMVTA
ncbi:hypothetical protein [Rhizobium leguminosarum]|uniref:hypothetical protein n=1 Tax=Rhizobium leguminosarum TaxID=384 RepID=UPI001C944CE3|nr:hypothetical protein [Rhizobium leguminosarum]MBY5581869.1 hypothetical protein [Rhizobium leguminosarum]